MPFEINFNVAQMVGIFASAIVVFAFSMKQDSRYKGIITAANILFMIHFYLLGAYAGAGASFIDTLRGYLSIKYHKSNKLMFFFMACYGVMAVFFVQQWIDILPFVTGVLVCFGLYKLSGVRLRLLLLVGSIMWMIYNIIFLSIGGIMTECFVIMVNSITIYGLMKDKKNAV